MRRCIALCLFLALAVPGRPLAAEQLDGAADEVAQPQLEPIPRPVPQRETPSAEGKHRASPAEPRIPDLPPTADSVDEPMAGPILGAEPMGCDDCGPEYNPCGPECEPCGPECAGCPTCVMPPYCPWSWGYVKTDYLMWWSKGMRVPSLVTTGPEDTDREVAGVLEQAGTEVIFGDTRLLEEERSGGRLIVGAWRDPCRRVGWEGEYIALGTAGEGFAAESTGDPILARPFFNALTREQAAELVAFPDVIEGSIGVDTIGRFTGAGVRLRVNRWDQPLCWQPAWNPCITFQGFRRWDFLFGYRFLRLDENLTVRENLSSLETDLPFDFDILDVFDTENRFHGGELGLLYEARIGPFSLEMLGKVALGNSHQVVLIDGSTEIRTQGTSQRDTFPGGILAQRTNMGTYSQNSFAVVPEVGVTLGYQLTPVMKFTFGYSFVYWSRVGRPGDQIDLVLNPNLFPEEEDPFSGPLRPSFTFRDSSFWAQGISFGLDCRW